MLANRSFGGAQVSRTFYARGQTGQQLLLGAYQALARQIAAGKVKMFPRTEMLDLVVDDGRGARHRRARPGHRRDRAPRRARRGARHRRLRQRLLPVDQRQGLQRDRDLARAQARRAVRQPLLHADPPDLHPGLRRLPVEADPDVGVAAQRRPHLGAEEEGRHAQGRRHSGGRARLLPRGEVPELRQPGAARRRVAQRQGRSATRAAASARAASGVYLDFAESIGRLGKKAIEERYGNLFEMYEKITGEDPYTVADAHLPGGPLHDGRAVGRLPPDVDRPRPVRCSARRTSRTTAPTGSGASALMQGLADGYFVIPYTIGDYLAQQHGREARRPTTAAVRRGRGRGARRGCSRLLAVRGKRTVDSFHRELGKIMWENCGMARNAAGLRRRRCRRSPSCAQEFWENVNVLGAGESLNQSLEKAGRVADFLELGELMCRDALRPRRSPAAATSARRARPPEGEALARRREASPTSPPGRWRASGKGRALHKEPLDLRVRPPRRRGATSDERAMNLKLNVWRQAAAAGAGDDGHLRGARRQPRTCRSSRCSTSSTSA